MNKSVKFKDVFEDLITGEWGNECSDNKNGVFIIRTTNFTNEGIINFENVIKRNISQNKIKEKRLKEGDIIIEKSGGTDKTPVGRVVYCDKEIESNIYLCNNFTQVLRVNRTVANPKYIFYYMFYLHMKGITKLLQSKTTGIRNLQMNSYLNMKCVSPSLNEQKKIVYILNKVTSLVQLKKEQIKKYDIIKQSLFIEMFGDPIKNPMNWNKEKLENKCQIITGNTPSRKIDNYYGNYIEWIKSDNIDINQSIITKAVEYLSEKGLKVGRCVDNNSILMTCIAGSIKCIGNVAITNRKVAFNQQINAIVPNNQNVWFMYIQFKICQQYIQGSINMSLKGILSKSRLSELLFIFPPMKLQNQFAERVQQIDKSKYASDYVKLIFIQNKILNIFFS